MTDESPKQTRAIFTVGGPWVAEWRAIYAMLGGGLFGGTLRLKPLTLRMAQELRLAGNGFFLPDAECEPGAGDVGTALWRMSESFKRHPFPLGKAWRVKRFIARQVHRMFLSNSRRRVRALIDEQAQGWPLLRDLTTPIGISEKAGRYDRVAAYVAFFAANFGWSDDKILDTPIAKLNQLYRAVRDLSGKKEARYG